MSSKSIYSFINALHSQVHFIAIGFIHPCQTCMHFLQLTRVLLAFQENSSTFETIDRCLLKLETDPLTALNMPIHNHSFNTLFQSKDIKNYYADGPLSDFYTVASLFKTEKRTFLYQPAKWYNYNEINPKSADLDVNMRASINLAFHIFKNKLPTLPSTPPKGIKQNETFLTSLCFYFDNHKKFTSAIKHILQPEISTPPAYATRGRDNVERPTERQFQDSFRMIHFMRAPASLKQFQFSVLSRTIVSRNKLFKWGKINTDKCPIIECNSELSTSEHMLLYCRFPKLFLNFFAEFSKSKFGLSTSMISHSQYLFSFPFEKPPKGSQRPNFQKYETQIYFLCILVKQTAYTLTLDDELSSFRKRLFGAKLLTTIKATLEHLQILKLDYTLISSFLDYACENLTGYVDFYIPS